MNNLKTDGLQIAYDKRVIVDALNIEIPKGKITALVGANGSGKSTILKTMSRLMKPSKGHVFLDGKAIHRQSTKEIAKQLAILPQNPTAPDGLTVSELVSYGRSPHQSGFKSMSVKDRDMIQWALRVTSLNDFADRPIDSLSGGQRQRAWIAMALAQETDILFLDEPTTFLDMTHQLEVLMLLKQLNLQENRTIVMVVHDLNHASRFADHMIAIRSGQVISEGSPVNVMTEQTLEDVFGIKADIMLDPRTGVPLCLPYETCQACEIRQVATKLAGEVVVKLV
ncbi:ABC transporter ATP-binding protein [Listeria cornellensis]|uniref:Iron ABC transporter ATP-binding protein n=1 Tax=Listeria cornellensis FSL F6-0969 TaxID=1265820 RepID=W7C1E3_9LIST|nr:ABC transporter ATP-binding protein [Listeria cornellensis]EUJ31035.1 iron ABC transporter ATP-binding protein [Listeria cornellensis FSL F6-0969]